MRSVRLTESCQSGSPPMPICIGRGSWRGVEPELELDVVPAALLELPRLGDLPARRPADRGDRLGPGGVGLAQAADGRHPVGRGERLVDDAPGAHRVGDAAVAPVPAVAEDLGLGDEEQRHRLDQGVVDAAAELELDRVAEVDAVLVAGEVEGGQLGRRGPGGRCACQEGRSRAPDRQHPQGCGAERSQQAAAAQRAGGRRRDHGVGVSRCFSISVKEEAVGSRGGRRDCRRRAVIVGQRQQVPGRRRRRQAGRRRRAVAKKRRSGPGPRP